MNDQIQFETPENIQISYEPAGAGTRFVAWFVDSIIMFIVAIVILFGLVMFGLATDSLQRTLIEPILDKAGNPQESDPSQSPQFFLYFMGIWTLIWGLGSFVYYGASELCFRGQTIGKRNQHIRVVKVSGFSLDASSIFVRNIFRVLDHLPPLWIVPVLSAKSQRLGDMVAGTLVVIDKPPQMNQIRDLLSRRTTEEAKFWFDGTQLKRLRPKDIQSIEEILERWSDLNAAYKSDLMSQIIPTIANRLQTDAPAVADQLHFMEDLLAAEYRRQDRNLG
jgi:uncharacterized RDD family membrane protein YckC